MGGIKFYIPLIHKRFSFTMFGLCGVDENFPEWSSADIAIVNAGLNVRPTDQLRIAAT